MDPVNGVAKFAIPLLRVIRAASVAMRSMPACAPSGKRAVREKRKRASVDLSKSVPRRLGEAFGKRIDPSAGVGRHRLRTPRSRGLLIGARASRVRCIELVYEAAEVFLDGEVFRIGVADFVAQRLRLGSDQVIWRRFAAES